MDVLTLANQWFAKYGAELAVKKRSGALFIWPKTALYKMTAYDRQCLVEYRDELVALVRSGRQPKLPDEPMVGANTTTDTTTDTTPVCIYCRRPCVGSDHPAYPTLHWDAPDEVRRRGAECDAAIPRRRPRF